MIQSRGENLGPNRRVLGLLPAFKREGADRWLLDMFFFSPPRDRFVSDESVFLSHYFRIIPEFTSVERGLWVAGDR